MARYRKPNQRRIQLSDSVVEWIGILMFCAVLWLYIGNGGVAR